MTDQNRKTLRSFYCRDYLWELFEVMTRDLGCSMDYLINEAMRHYARSRNYSLAAPQYRSEPEPMEDLPLNAAAAPTPPPLVRSGAPSRRRPPPLPSKAGEAAVPSRQRPTLYLIFNGQRYRIDREKFVIGRGSQETDLTIRDGNISRKHSAIIFHNGHFFIKDLDSTNGIEYNGKRIEHKRIEEGDTFYLCDYEIRFTFQ